MKHVVLVWSHISNMRIPPINAFTQVHLKYNSWRHDTRHIDVHVSDRAPNSRLTHFIPYFERMSESRQETSTVVCSYATSASFHATFAHDSFFIFCSNKHVCLHKTCKQFKLKFRNGLQTYLSSPQRKFRIHLRVTYTQC